MGQNPVVWTHEEQEGPETCLEEKAMWFCGYIESYWDPQDPRDPRRVQASLYLWLGL